MNEQEKEEMYAVMEKYCGKEEADECREFEKRCKKLAPQFEKFQAKFRK